MKIYFCRTLSKTISLVVFFSSLISLQGDSLNAENLFEELQIDSSTKMEEDRSIIPTNPF
jgi:hypothetical protein